MHRGRWKQIGMIGLLTATLTGCIDLAAGQAQWNQMRAITPDYPAPSYSLTSCSSSCKDQKCRATCVTW